MKTGPAAILAMLVIAIGASKASACSCACDAGYTFDQYVDNASVIVLGRVIELKSKPPDPNADPLTKQFIAQLGVAPSDLTFISSCGDRWVRVSVQEVVKGEVGSEITFVQGAVGTACDFDFPLNEGAVYLLFGMPSRDGTTIHLPGCSPSVPAAQARQTIVRVRKRLAEAS